MREERRSRHDRLRGSPFQLEALDRYRARDRQPWRETELGPSDHEDEGPPERQYDVPGEPDSGISRLLALLPKELRHASLINLDSLWRRRNTAWLRALVGASDAAPLADRIGASAQARDLIEAHRVGAIVALYDTQSPKSLRIAAAKSLLDRGWSHVDLDALMTVPARMPGDWEYPWFVDLDHLLLRATTPEFAPPPGFGAVSLSEPSTIAGIAIRFATDGHGGADVDDQKKTLSALYAAREDVRTMPSGLPRARLMGVLGVTGKKDPLPLLIAAPPPVRDIVASPMTAPVFLTGHDVGKPSLRVAAVRIPQSTLLSLWRQPYSPQTPPPQKLKHVLLHELVHAFLIRKRASVWTIADQELKRLSLAAPPRLVRAFALLLHLHLLAQEELQTFGAVGSLYPMNRPVTIYDKFLKESWKYFESKGATRRTVTRVVKLPGGRKWKVAFASPGSISPLGYGDAAAMRPALRAYPPPT